MQERMIENQQDLYISFIDYVNEFLWVQHETMVEMLVSLNFDPVELKVLKSQYWDQEAVVCINIVVVEYVHIERGMRQGCIMSHRNRRLER